MKILSILCIRFRPVVLQVIRVPALSILCIRFIPVDVLRPKRREGGNTILSILCIRFS